MVRISIILVFFFASSILNAQENNCKKINNSLYYIEMDIRRVDNYPIIMSGICNTVNFDSLVKENEDFFINSFYKLCFYTPNIQGDNKKVISDCLGSNELENYLSDYGSEVLKMASKINRNSLERIINLKNNSTVYLKICKIKGSFIETSKMNKNISKNSNELEINDIMEIDKVYIPLKISCYKKPKNKELL